MLFPNCVDMKYSKPFIYIIYTWHMSYLLEVLQSVDDCGEKVKDWPSQPEEVDEPNRN